MSAFSCRPGRGSEPGAGWQWTRAAAQGARVWLLTERSNQPFLDAALAEMPLRNLTPVYVDLPAATARWSSEDQRIRLRYAAWQLAARRVALRLHADIGFDVVHHLTFSADWQPVGLPALPGAAFVWGPIGGAAPVPWRLRRWLDGRAMAGEVVRAAAGAAGRRVFGESAARRAHVVLCQNRDVARRFRHASGAVVLEPNVALDREELAQVAVRDRQSQTAVFAGRLQDWKGLRIAVATMARSEVEDWRLVVLGEGPSEPGARALAVELGVADRVDFLGLLPRAQALAQIGAASALLLPSMHDACGWVVAEALALGTPPVVLDVGGPPLLVERAGTGVSVPVTADPTRALAEALRGVKAGPATRAFDDDRVADVLRRTYDEAMARR